MTDGHDRSRGRPAVPGGLLGRAQERIAVGLIMGALQSLRYPLDREGLGVEARRRGAPRVMLDLLERMPDRAYVSAEDVAREARRAWETW